MLSALWRLDTGICNSRAMSRRPKPFALSLTTSAVHPLMIAREDALRHGAITTGAARPDTAPEDRRHAAGDRCQCSAPSLSTMPASTLEERGALVRPGTADILLDVRELKASLVK